MFISRGSCSLLVATLLCLVPALAFATIQVSPGHSIQQAIMDATEGETVIVAAGTYHERINFYGKRLTVRSSAPGVPSVVAATIIDGGKAGSVVRFDHNETSDSVLSGFTITNGSGTSSDYHFQGGGIYISSSSPTIQYNVIKGNSVTWGGGGIYCVNSNAVIQDNTIRDNVSSPYGVGGGLCLANGLPAVRHNLITGNSAISEGGGIYCESSAIIESNTIVGNTAGLVGDSGQGGGLYCDEFAPTIRDNIIAFSKVGGGLCVAKIAALAFTYCDVYGNTDGDYQGVTSLTGKKGNISKDPLFADAAHGDYRLKSAGGRWNGTAWVKDSVSSPCLDSGDPTADYHFEPLPNGGCLNLGFDGDTDYASKTPPPTMTAHWPKGNSASRGANVTVTFSTAMKHGSAEGAMTINGVSATTFGGAFSWQGNQMIFNPTANLAADKQYTVVIGKAARSMAEVHLAKAVSWTFKTVATAPALVAAAAVPTFAGAQITVNLTAAAEVTVTIRNLAGREIAVLTPGEMEAGVHSLLWNGTSTSGTKAPAGTYLVQVGARGAEGATASALATLRH